MKTHKHLFALLSLIVFLLPWGIDCFFPEWKVTNYASGVAILLGVAYAALFGAPLLAVTSKAVPWMLGASIVGIGFTTNLMVVLSTGQCAFLYTVVAILSTLLLGVAIGRWLKLEENTSLLISVGTAICGGSAIAAAAPVLKAKAHEIALATATVFVLNGIALVLFPMIGHALDFNQAQFGTWAALAIHDTSSVVGASLAYGEEAKVVGTTVKLLRALWIVPVAFSLSVWVGLRNRATMEGAKGKVKVKVPWFIPGFLIATALFTFLPEILPDAGDKALAAFSKGLKSFIKYFMVLTLFWVGSNISIDKVKAMGIRPLVQGMLLWVIVATAWVLVLLFSGLPYPGQSI